MCTVRMPNFKTSKKPVLKLLRTVGEVAESQRYGPVQPHSIDPERKIY